MSIILITKDLVSVLPRPVKFFFGISSCICYLIKHIFIIKPTFSKYKDMDAVYRRLLKVIVPGNLKWEEMCDLLD